MKKRLLIVLSLIIFGVVGYLGYQKFQRAAGTRPNSAEQGIVSEDVTEDSEAITVVAQDLEVPWAIVELPGGDLLITERPGRLRRIGANQQVHNIEGVRHIGEGGLMGLALHPDYEENRQIYLYLTTQANGQLSNRVERYTYQNDRLSNRTVILDDIPGAVNHDGGALAFGPDGKLYVTSGDAGVPDNAQDRSSLAGKILRLNDDGSTPDDNPFANLVYSYGHRNPQGIAWDDKDQMWSVEHGPSGVNSGFDELNRIVKGGNYGWPVIQGDEQQAGMITPVAQSGSEDTWAPAGLAHAGGSLFFVGLRGQSLYEAKIIADDQVELKAHFSREYGRLRGVTLIGEGSGGALVITTSNRDGRGQPQANDDKIIKIQRALFD